MPGFGPKYFNCVLCGIRTKPKNRRHVRKDVQKYLRKNFMLESKIGDTICNKCVCTFHRTNSCSHVEKIQCTVKEAKKADSSTTSLPSQIRLNIQCTVRSHSYCTLCKRPGPKLITVPAGIRFRFFLDHNVLLPAGCRCCPNHVQNDKIVGNFNLQPSTSVLLNSEDLEKLIGKLRTTAITYSKTRIDFDNEDEMTDDDYVTLTGHKKSDFREICQHAEQVRKTPARSLRTSVGIFLMKMKSGLSNKLMATIFNISKSSLRRAISSVRIALLNSFVPQYLGFEHVTRERIISEHTRPLAQFLFGDQEESRAILVIDGTYIYIQKSDNFKFQRRTYSLYKGRPLVKPMVICSTSGYFLSIMGPYYSDSKNNDAAILNHALKKNVDSIREWVQENDVFVVDRGFRDSLDLLEDLGIRAQMPSFLKRGEKQLSSADANSSRLVSKVSILNLSHQVNKLQERVVDNGLDKRKVIWKSVDDDSLDDFPRLDEEDLSNITCGTYQLRLSPSYIKEHIDGEADIYINREDPGLIQVKLQSRHVSSRKYTLWIEFTPSNIVATYCKCRAGARVVGVCSHVAAVLWYLGFSRHQECQTYGIQDWGNSLCDASILDESDSDESIMEE